MDEDVPMTQPPLASSTGSTPFTSSTSSTISAAPADYFLDLQDRLAAEAGRIHQLGIAAAAKSPPVNKMKVALKVLQMLKQVLGEKISQYQIVPRYCKLDPRHDFRHPPFCECNLHVTDPDASQESFIGLLDMESDEVARFIHSIPQGHALWKAFHHLMISGTSAYFAAGCSTQYKHWLAEFALRLGIIMDAPDQKQMVTMTGGKFFEKPIRKRYERYLQARNKNPNIAIEDDGGLRLPRHKELRFIGHSNDGLIPELNSLFELKVKRWLGNKPLEIEANYVAQLQVGLLITENNKGRLLACERPKEQKLPLPAQLWADEYEMALSEQYLTALVRRIAYFCTALALWRIPEQKSFESIGALPTVKASVSRIRM